MSKSLLILIFLFASSPHVYGQTAKAAVTKKPVAGESVSAARTSPAYAEVLLKRTELEADLESLILEYTEEYPKVKDIRLTLQLIEKETGRLKAVKPSDAARLSSALGKLIVRKIELESEMWLLLRNYKQDHPDVQRAKRKVEIYEAAIKEILG